MFNLFKKTNQQKIALGSKIFSNSEYNDFIKLIKSDFLSRNIEVDSIKDGYLSAKIDGDDKNFGLINIAQNCNLIAHTEWPLVIKEHFDTLAQIRNDEAELKKNLTDFDKIKNLLAIQLYPDDYLNALDELKNEVITKKSIPIVNSTIVLDLPASIRPIKKSEIKSWNKTENELFSIALNNTFNKIKPEITEKQISNGKVIFITSDNFLTAVLVLNLEKFNQCIGIHGSLVAIPTREVIMCSPINDLGIVEAINSFIPFVSKLYYEGPGSLSPKLYWYQNNTFTDLPYKIEDEKLTFIPPKNFIATLNKLEKSKS